VWIKDSLCFIRIETSIDDILQNIAQCHQDDATLYAWAHSEP